MTNCELIYILIQRYFDATATEEEEEQLKQLLSDPTTESTPEVEEARAVMGYSAVQKAIHTPERKTVKPIVSRWTRAAAAAAILVGIITGTYQIHKQQSSAESYAAVYTDGKMITSTDEAIAIMHSQLGAIGSADSRTATAEAFSALDAMIHND